MSFTHLQVKSGYSLMKSTITIPKLIQRAKQLDFHALAITDEHVLYGVIPFYKACMANDIKPLIGMTVSIIAQDRETEICILLAKTNHGYQQLSKLSTYIQTNQKDGLEIAYLQEYSKDLICILPFLHSKLKYMISAGSEERIKAYLHSWQEIFATGDFYIGVQDHGGEQERQMLQRLKSILQQNRLPAVAINDVYYLQEQDDRAFDCLQAIRRGVPWDGSHVKMEEKKHHLRSTEEMTQVFHEWPAVLAETNQITEKCNVSFSFENRMLPSYPLPDHQDADSYLRNLCEKHFAQKYPQASKQVRERLEYELQVITDMQFSDYFLIVWDFIKYAKEHHIMVGPGRGSSAGSLVAYVLNITEVDPIKHQLLFERFLNPERVTMPDIDVDFSDQRRDEVIAYVQNKYGAAHVAQIVTFGTFASRSITRELMKTLEIDQQDSGFILKQMPQQTSRPIKQILQDIPQLQQYVRQSGKLTQLFTLAMQLEGLPRHISTHAAGVVISEEPLQKHVPLTTGGSDMHLTQFTMNDLESIGLLKIDFLGLRNLTLLERIVQSINQNTGKKVSLQSIKEKDEQTFQMLRTGRTNGIFQLESEGMKRVLTQLQPSSFEDIVAVNALYRPGPMENISIYIARKHGKQQITYPHPDLKPILESTYGVLIYQEQIMQIAHDIAGFSLGEADILRRAVSKKKKDVMHQQEKDFIQGCLKNGYHESVAEELFAWIVKFSNYGFPKGHAVAYSKIAYQLAYLKAHFTVYFYAELLSTVSQDKNQLYLKEMKEFGIQLLPPSVNRSYGRYTVEDGAIRIGLLGIKRVSGKTVKVIINTRGNKGFSSLFDFYLRISEKAVSQSVMETLIMAGAFDDMHHNRASLLASIDKAVEQGDLFKEFAQQTDLFKNQFPLEESYVDMDDFTQMKKLADEKELLGMYVSSHPLKKQRHLLQQQGYISVTDAFKYAGKSNASTAVIVQEIKKIRTKRGDSMAFLIVADETGEIDAVLFPDRYRECSNWLEEEMTIMIKGKIEWRQSKWQWVIFSLQPFQLDHIENEEVVLAIQVVNHTGRETMSFLKNIMKQFPGKTPVMISHDQQSYRIKNCLLQPVSDCIRQLEEFFGKDHVARINVN